MIKHLKEISKKDSIHKELWMNCSKYKTDTAKELASQKFPVASQSNDSSFDPVKLRQLITNWIVTSDQAFIELENCWLQRAFEYCNPKALEALVTGNTVKSDILKNNINHKEELIARISVMILFNFSKFMAV